MTDIAEEKLTYEDGVPIYTVKIKDFKEKLKWDNCKVIESKVFTVAKIGWCLNIYPNGNTSDSKGYVSVYLKIKGTDTVVVKGVINVNVGDVEKTTPTHRTYYGLASWGYSDLVSHDYIKNNSDDDTLVISYKFDSVMELGVGVEESLDKLKDLDNKLEELDSKEDIIEIKSKLNHLETKLDEIDPEEQVVKKIKLELTEQLNRLGEKIDSNAAGDNNNFVKPRCPVCYEEMSSNTKIAQCLNGHLLCWSCKERLEDMDCSACGQPVNGRAFGMETYILEDSLWKGAKEGNSSKKLNGFYEMSFI